MKKREQIKRKHHHVWSYYLKQWSINNRDVFYTTSKGKISNDSVKGLARELDFYKVSFPTERDIAFIRRFSALSPVEIRDIHESFLEGFTQFSTISQFSSHSSFPKEILKELELAKHNLLEDIHSQFESEMLPILERLCKGDVSVLCEKGNMVIFLSYLGQQFTRSKAFKDNVMKVAFSFDRFPQNMPMSRKEYLLLFNKNWWFLSFMFGLNAGASFNITKTKDNHVFLINNTDEPFITTDNTLVNMHESLSELEEFEAPTEADLYYPLSPKFAYMINNSNRYPRGSIIVTKEEVIELNNKMAKKSNKHIFSNSREQLERVKNAN